MRKSAAIIAAAIAASATASAQSLEIVTDAAIYSIPAAIAGEMFVETDGSFTALGHTYPASDIRSIRVADNSVDADNISIVYNGETATVTVSGTLADRVSVAVEGASVTVGQTADAPTISYTLSGTSENGNLYVTASTDTRFIFDNLNLKAATVAPVEIKNSAATAYVTLRGNSSLTDTDDNGRGSVFICKGNLVLDGDGALTVTGIKNHGINTGSMTVSGATVNAAISANAAKAVKVDYDFTIESGHMTVTTSGGGQWDSEKLKTKASACIAADGNTYIKGGTLDLTATGCAGKGINCDGTLEITDGDITIHTSGGIYAYVNGNEYIDYTGNTDRLDSDAKSSPKGIKADGNISISGGRIHVTTTGNGGEGIESKAEMTVSGGDIVIRSYDDGLNSSSHMYITGGDIEIIATNNDAIDSNGNMYISGGTIRAFGGSAPECGLDANEEEGYSVYFTGGVIFAAGGSQSSLPSSAESTQAYIVLSQSLTAGSDVTVTSPSGDTIGTFAVPADYKTSGGSNRPGGFGPGGSGNGSSLLVSTPDMQSGSSYTVSNGSASTSATAVTKGGSSGGPGGRPF